MFPFPFFLFFSVSVTVSVDGIFSINGYLRFLWVFIIRVLEKLYNWRIFMPSSCYCVLESVCSLAHYKTLQLNNCIQQTAVSLYFAQ